MLDETQKIKVKWNNANRKIYESKGYFFTKIKDEFEIEAKDLSHSSGEKIKVICDYCGETTIKSYKNYFVQKNNGKDCCNSKLCKQTKKKETMIKKYGTENIMEIPQFKEKQKQTLLNKYGVENPSQINWVQEKKIKTNNKKYGTDWFTQSKKFESICTEKYGVRNPLQSKDILEKRNKSFLKNNTTPTSKEEIKLFKILTELYGESNCIKSYVYKNFIMDCMLEINGIKIDVEYDGWYWHKSRIKQDRIRDEVLKNSSFKILRIRSNGDMPKNEQIIECVDYLMGDNHDYTCININI